MSLTTKYFWLCLPYSSFVCRFNYRCFKRDRSNSVESRMMNPRHTCRMQLAVCPGPCNPRLRTQHCHRQHHHHHHHHHRRREKFYDANSDATPAQLKQDLRSFKPDVALGTSKGGESLSKTSSFSRIALVKVTSVPRILQPEVVHWSQTTLKLVESSTMFTRIERQSSVTRNIESAFLMAENLSQRQEIFTIARFQVKRVSKALSDAKNAIARKLPNGLKRRGTSILVSYLMIMTIYVGIHILLAVLTWQTPAHHFFVSSQICGILALLMWRITGTILIWTALQAARIDNTSR